MTMSSHGEAILSGLDSLRRNGELIDVTLVAGGRSFSAHRAVLASCSDYFRAMFGGWRESRAKVVRLGGAVSADGVAMLLDYAYTSQLPLSADNVLHALAAAAYAMLANAVNACEDYLVRNIHKDNCLQMITVAETYTLHRLRDTAYRFMSAHLVHFIRSDDFLSLPADQLKHLLECDYPVDCLETELSDAVASWSAANDAATCASDLVSRLRITDALPPAPLVNLRGIELVIVAIGGIGPSGLTNAVTCISPAGSDKTALTTIPHVNQRDFGAAVLGNRMYVIGGCFDQGLQEQTHPFGFCYSPLDRAWTTIARMTRERCRFALVASGEFLYAIGGENEDVSPEYDHTFSSIEQNVERYDPSADTWLTLKPMPVACMRHAACSLPTDNDNVILVVSGGIDRFFVLSSTMAYDPVADEWRTCAPMLAPRVDHALLAIGGRAYACGGWYDLNDQRTLVAEIDAYDPIADRWEHVTAVPTPRYHAGIVAIGSKIYITGGFCDEALFHKSTPAMECYDVEADAWTTIHDHLRDVREHMCVTLYVPKAHRSNAASTSD